jgi:uncharacterized protein (DUF433 family)
MKGPDEMTTAMSGHIVIDDAGVARMAGSRVRVIDLIMAGQANHWGPAELHDNYPQFTLADIHAALSYYFDYQSQCDIQIAASIERADELQASTPVPPVVERLRAIKASQSGE